MHIPVLKNSFGFRLAATSYIIPEGFMKNISFLGRYVDEIALVLFDTGNENNLPSKTEVREKAPPRSSTSPITCICPLMSSSATPTPQ